MGSLLEISQYYGPEEAYCAKAYLASHGVDAFFQNEHHLTAAPWLRVALGGYRLQVAAEDAEKAKRLLAEVSEAESKQPRQSKKSKGRRLQTWIWLPVAFATSVPFIPLRRSGWIRAIELAALLSLYILLLWIMFIWIEWLIRP